MPPIATIRKPYIPFQDGLFARNVVIFQFLLDEWLYYAWMSREGLSLVGKFTNIRAISIGITRISILDVNGAILEF